MLCIRVVMRMASVNLSLDDIIQKKAVKFSGLRGKGRMVKGQLRTVSGNRSQLRLKGNTEQQIRRRRAPLLGDARFRIIQRNRQKLTDAREKLGEIAKQHDARLKLDKLRQVRLKERSIVLPGSNITRKTGRNGQLTLSTNRKKDITMRNVRQNSRGFKEPLPSLLDLDVDMEEDAQPLPVIQRTVNNNVSNQQAMYSSMDRSRYSWMNETPGERRQQKSLVSNMGHRTASSNLKIVTHNTGARPIKTQSSSLMSDREEWRSELEDSEEDLVEGPWPRSASTPIGRMSSELKARLDTPTSSPRTMGILSATSTKPSATPAAPQGHRIVVSNLQTSVTQEDIRELFEDIGTLLASRLVRPGTAEVIYVQHKDALKAVDVYHNRQLDGQPMKCMLVNTRSPGLPTASRTSGSGTRTSSDGTLKLPTGGKSSVAPDIGTIHKALFNKS